MANIWWSDWVKMGTTYQHESGGYTDFYGVISCDVMWETATQCNFEFQAGFRSSGFNNEYIWQLGLYCYYGTSTTPDWNYGGHYGGNATKMQGSDLYTPIYSVTVDKRSDTSIRVAPYMQAVGMSKELNTDSHWSNGDFWIWGNTYGCIDMRSTNTSMVQLGTANYGSVRCDGWLYKCGKVTNQGGIGSAPASDPVYTVPTKGIPIYVHNGSAWKKAQAVALYAGGAKKTVKSVTTYDSSGKPHTITI